MYYQTLEIQGFFLFDLQLTTSLQKKPKYSVLYFGFED
ncbi:hypothetical protein P799_21725 [Lysinibacillus sphaericus CBAM5]|uniref:Uncharacterized protein n=1 Tax=Lysinibacillus sphaericus CBAM5 TaxID=1400869 RepID=W7RFL2_LYSSH|nr:hypothetical protein P799_24435 [Lysinibacillus sphaericus CBAM5]EWH30986.1 hypothetical protein P799_21725 [Lysinibacillus sphaericus CBAM5]